MRSSILIIESGHTGYTGAPAYPLLTADHIQNIVALDTWAYNTYHWKMKMIEKGHTFRFNNTHESDHHYGDDVTSVDRRLVTLTMAAEHGSLTLTNLDTHDVNLTKGNGTFAKCKLCPIVFYDIFFSIKFFHC